MALLLAERTDFAACFMGMLRSSMQCQVCLTVGLKYEPFWDITVHCPQVGVMCAALQECS